MFEVVRRLPIHEEKENPIHQHLSSQLTPSSIVRTIPRVFLRIQHTYDAHRKKERTLDPDRTNCIRLSFSFSRKRKELGLHDRSRCLQSREDHFVEHVYINSRRYSKTEEIMVSNKRSQNQNGLLYISSFGYEQLKNLQNNEAQQMETPNIKSKQIAILIQQGNVFSSLF
jgi:hypothetical protein